MAKKLISEIVTLDSLQPINSDNIETLLSDKYGSIVRWAIVEIFDKSIKISLTYEEK